MATWFKELTRRARRRDREAHKNHHPEAAFVGRVCTILLNEIFQIEPSKRITADEIYRKLDTIGSLRRVWHEPNSDAASSAASIHQPALSAIGRMFSRIHRYSKSRPQHPRDVCDLALSGELNGAHAKRVVVGPDGDLVVIHSDRSLAVYSGEQVVRKINDLHRACGANAESSSSSGTHFWQCFRRARSNSGP